MRSKIVKFRHRKKCSADSHYRRNRWITRALQARARSVECIYTTCVCLQGPIHPLAREPKNGMRNRAKSCNIFILKKSLFGAMGGGSEAVARLMEMLRMRTTHKRAYQSSTKAEIQTQQLICAVREENEVSRFLRAGDCCRASATA